MRRSQARLRDPAAGSSNSISLTAPPNKITGEPSRATSRCNHRPPTSPSRVSRTGRIFITVRSCSQQPGGKASRDEDGVISAYEPALLRWSWCAQVSIR